MDAASAPTTRAGVIPSAQGPAQPPVAPPPQYGAPIPPPMYLPPTGAARYGGFWIRFVAAIIDGIAVGIVTGPVSLIIAVFAGLAGRAASIPEPGVHFAHFTIASAFGTVVSWIYEAAMQSSSYQATLGKMALGLRVTDLEGGRISFGRATARHFSKWLSWMTFTIGFIIAGFSSRKQALHDLIAGTLVVRTM